MATYPVVEHGAGRTGRWLRARRFRLAVLLGALETIWIVFTDATWRWALVVAALVFAFHFLVGRRTRVETVRQVSWTAAASQVMPVLVPFVVLAVGTLLVAAVIAVAVVAVALLLLDRR